VDGGVDSEQLNNAVYFILVIIVVVIKLEFSVYIATLRL
jgi:hypothetical protein